jgi:hypothetical protein
MGALLFRFLLTYNRRLAAGPGRLIASKSREGLASFRGGRHFRMRAGRDRVAPKAHGRITDISFQKSESLLGSKFFRSGSPLRHERASTKLRRKPRESMNVV